MAVFTLMLVLLGLCIFAQSGNGQRDAATLHEAHVGMMQSGDSAQDGVASPIVTDAQLQPVFLANGNPVFQRPGRQEKRDSSSVHRARIQKDTDVAQNSVSGYDNRNRAYNNPRYRDQGKRPENAELRRSNYKRLPTSDKDDRRAGTNVPFTVHGIQEADPKSDDAMLSAMSMQGCMSTVAKMATGSGNDVRSGEAIPAMSDDKMKATCKMYMKWGENMRKKSEWTPTDGQMSWWKSLAMDSTDNNKKDVRYKDGNSAAYGRSQTQDQRHHGRATRQSGNGQALRKEYRALTDNERGRFHDAVNSLKNTWTDGMSRYDIFVRFHQANVAPGAHFGPAFYGYHRELLFRDPYGLGISASLPVSWWAYPEPPHAHPSPPSAWGSYPEQAPRQTQYSY